MIEDTAGVPDSSRAESRKSAKYIAVPYESTFVGFDQYIICALGSNKRLRVSSFVKKMLDRCRTWGTLDRLSERASEAFAEEEQNAKGSIDNAMALLLGNGLVVPTDSLLPHAPSRGRSQISSVAFVTSGRPGSLKAAVTSFYDNFRRYDRNVELVVIDDSPSDQMAALTREAAQDCARNAAVQYCGVTQKRNYIKELSRMGISPEVANFGLLGDSSTEFCTTGANRNSCLLASLDRCIFMIDDDNECKLAAHPGAEACVHFAGHRSPRDSWFYRDRETLRRSLNWGSLDILGEHERFLGKTFGELGSSALLSDVRLDEVCPHILLALQRGEGSIVAGISGVAGDCGSPRSPWLSLTQPSTRERLAGSEELFDHALTGRETLSVSQYFSITHPHLCAGAGLSLSNNGGLPPFLPIGTGQDTAFGRVLWLLDPAAYVVHVPIAILHASNGVRTYEALPVVRFWEVIVSLASQFDCVRPTFRDSIVCLGRQLTELSSLPDRDFWQVACGAISARHVENLRSLESQLDGFPECPPFWRKKLIEYHKQYACELESEHFYLPLELRERSSTLSIIQESRRLTEKMAALFCAWPDMIEAARELYGRGITMTRDVNTL